MLHRLVFHQSSSLAKYLANVLIPLTMSLVLIFMFQVNLSSVGNFIELVKFLQVVFSVRQLKFQYQSHILARYFIILLFVKLIICTLSLIHLSKSCTNRCAFDWL